MASSHYSRELPKLFGTAISTCTQRVLLAAAELGIQVDLRALNFAAREHKTPEHIARQPFGKIPVLEDGDFSFYESRAIVNYIIRKYGASSGLLPSSLEQQARFDQWLSLESTVITPEICVINLHRVWHVYYPGFGVDEAAVAGAVKNLQTPLDVMDKHLATNQFLVGDTFTAIDIIFLPYSSLVFDTTEEGKVLLASRPHLAAYWKRITDRASWQKVKAIMADAQAGKEVSGPTKTD